MQQRARWAIRRRWGMLAIWVLHACRAELSAPPARPAGEPPSTELTAFVLEPVDNPQLKAAVSGVISGREVQLELPFGSGTSGLVPRISHRGASVAPASGVAQDFAQPVDYTVTASDGSTATYTVMVQLLSQVIQPGAADAAPLEPPAPLDSTKQITHFSIAGVSATIAGDEITLTVPHDTRLFNITPELSYEGAAILPSPLTPQDFRSPVVYTVMARDGSSREFRVHVTVAANHGKSITHFRIFGIEAEITDGEISLQLPAGTDLTMLAPDISLSGGTVVPASGQPQDFSQPVLYTVTGADGTMERYTVLVSLAPGHATDIVRFEIPAVFTSLRGDEISLFAPFGTSDCIWAPAIEHAGARIEPAQGELQDFRRGVVYTVTASDGSSRSYTARCEIPETSARGIERFEVLGLAATIIGDDITLTVPNAVSLGALTPTIVHHGVRLHPASGGSQSFYGPVTYTLLETNGETRAYTVRIVNADRADNELVDLVIEGRHARITGQRVELTLPAGSDLSALSPTLLHRGARATPSAGPRDLSAPERYGVFARDGARRDYELSVRVAGASDKALTDLWLGSTVGTVRGSEITLRLPAGTDLRALSPSRLQHTGASISPEASEPQDFTRPVSYLVTAQDGSTERYQVHASVQDESAHELVAFRVLGIDAELSPMGAAISLPAGTQLTALVPQIRIAGAAIWPLSSLPQDLSQPVRYTITAADGGTSQHEVVITITN